MRRRTALKHFLGAATTCATCLTAPSAFGSGALKQSAKGKPDHGGEHWGYTGEEGPSHWGELTPKFQVCGLGIEQSPVNLTDAVSAKIVGLGINYHPTKLHVVNNGHTIQVNTDPGSSVMIGGKKFNLLQYHFHHPSEHLMSGKSFNLEAHFVHAASDGTLAVLGVFIEPGEHNAALAPVWDVMPRDAGTANGPMARPIELLPADRSYFRYMGSLTTPPCSQKVIWTVFRTPVQMSTSQVRQFASIFAMNARPVQNFGRRFLLRSL